MLAQNEDSLKNWVQNVLMNPGRYFASDYEEKIFEKFCQKYPFLKLLKVDQAGQQRICEFQLNPERDSYFLVFQLDHNNSIKRICRYISALNKMIEENPAKSGVEWLGKFLYRLDAGDSAAIMDLIFYKTVKVRYKNMDPKSNVISGLLKDSNFISDKTECNIQEKSNVYYIRITTAKLTELRIEIPVNLTIVAETDELQSQLLKKIILFINSDELGEGNLSTKKMPIFLEKVRQIYPDSKQNGDTLIISYPLKKISSIREIYYLIVNTSGDKNYQSLKLFPVISLTKEDQNINLLLNGVLSIPYYSSSKLGNIDLKSIERLLQYIYKLLLVKDVGRSDFLVNSIKGQLEYRGYEVQKISITSDTQWQGLWAVLREQGALYFYPSEINQDKKTLSIQGIVYIMRNPEDPFYHFCEIILTIDQLQTANQVNVALTFYPYIRNTEISQQKSVN